MFVLLFYIFKHLLLRKTDVLKTCRKIKFFGKKMWRNALALKSKKVQGTFGKKPILTLLSLAVFRLQSRVSEFFKNAFIRVPYEMKFSENWDMVCRWKSTDNNDINIFLSLENRYTFLLAKEKTWKGIFNINSELMQNRTVKQIILFKTAINCLFNDIWFYLIIGCFDWKIGVFQIKKRFSEATNTAKYAW